MQDMDIDYEKPRRVVSQVGGMWRADEWRGCEESLRWTWQGPLRHTRAEAVLDLIHHVSSDTLGLAQPNK